MIAGAALAAPAAQAQSQAQDPAQPKNGSAFVPISAEDQVARMGRGLNVLGYDPFWEANGVPRFKARHFAEIRKAGFSTIRVNLQAFRHMDAHGRLDDAWVKKLDWVVREATAAGLIVILDEHDFELCSADVNNCRNGLRAFWIQIGARYQNTPNTVLFELLNEPHAALDGEVWNGLLKDVLAEVRRYNPQRTVVIGPTMWNSRAELPKLKLPEDDRNIIVTFHYYTPMEFTHQGATWVGDKIQALHDVKWGAPEEVARMNADFDTVKAWSQAHRRPIFLGEFGAFDKGPMDYRVLYTRTAARSAEAHGFAWAYWQFDSNFLAWDMGKDDWVHPIKDALVPKDAQATR